MAVLFFLFCSEYARATPIVLFIFPDVHMKTALFFQLNKTDHFIYSLKWPMSHLRSVSGLSLKELAVQEKKKSKTNTLPLAVWVWIGNTWLLQRIFPLTATKQVVNSTSMPIFDSNTGILSSETGLDGCEVSVYYYSIN